MRFLIATTIILSLIPVCSSDAAAANNENKYPGESARILALCRIVKEKISSASQLFYPSDPGYNQTIAHFVSSSTIRSICSVEPGTVEDVATILKLIGQYRVPFAIKGGGHIFNPGFSSTTGIHISMSRFRKVVYHPYDETVDVGAGLIWNDVYQALEPYNVNVIGGRLSSIGVAGLALGCGYSWKSNEYGLSIDNICEYQLVAPDGRVVDVNEKSYPNIFFGLKGGHNNFGIVTNFKMRAVPQTLVYAGILTYSPPQFEAIVQAMVNFEAKNKDPKAQIVGYFILAEQYFLGLLVSYDAPTAPKGLWDEFLAIPHVGTVQTQSYLSWTEALDVSHLATPRARVTSVSINKMTVPFVNKVLNQLLYRNATLGSKPGAFLAVGFEPLHLPYFKKSSPSAFPHVASNPLYPVFIQFGWSSQSDDELFLNELKPMMDAILQFALEDGQDVGGSKQLICPNYANKDIPLSHIFGKNLLALQKIRKEWDPKNVMYLAGGFKL